MRKVVTANLRVAAADRPRRAGQSSGTRLHGFRVACPDTHQQLALAEVGGARHHPWARGSGLLCGRRDGFQRRALGECFDESLTLRCGGGRAVVLPAFGGEALHQRVERRASFHGFSVGRGVC